MFAKGDLQTGEASIEARSKELIGVAFGATLDQKQSRGYYLKQGKMTPAVNMQAVLSRAKQGERE